MTPASAAASHAVPTDFVVGRATGQDNNCLIDALRQALPSSITVPDDYRADRVRQELALEFTTGEARVIAPHDGHPNFLDLQLHWRAILLALGRQAFPEPAILNPHDFRIVCVDLNDPTRLSTSAGTGPQVLHIAREALSHFLPLQRVAGLDGT